MFKSSHPNKPTIPFAEPSHPSRNFTHNPQNCPSRFGSQSITDRNPSVRFPLTLSDFQEEAGDYRYYPTKFDIHKRYAFEFPALLKERFTQTGVAFDGCRVEISSRIVCWSKPGGNDEGGFVGYITVKLYKFMIRHLVEFWVRGKL